MQGLFLVAFTEAAQRAVTHPPTALQYLRFPLRRGVDNCPDPMMDDIACITQKTRAFTDSAPCVSMGPVSKCNRLSRERRGRPDPALRTGIRNGEGLRAVCRGEAGARGANEGGLGHEEGLTFDRPGERARLPRQRGLAARDPRQAAPEPLQLGPGWMTRRSGCDVVGVFSASFCAATECFLGLIWELSTGCALFLFPYFYF